MPNKYAYGIKPIDELLTNDPSSVDKIYVRDNLSGNNVHSIFNRASDHKIPVTRVPPSKLFDLVGDVNHQGVVAAISEITYIEFEDWLIDITPTPQTAVLCLDEIEDPHNFGAILRTAAAAGITAVIVPKHRQAPVNATVMKTSAGTAGRIPIVRAVNLNQAILTLKENKFWIAGLDQNAETTIWNQKYDVPMAFVIGNEGRGMRKKTGEHCDFLLSLPMHNDVESLNASVSAALVCYEWRRQKLDGI
ncbi:23S rRNA (guanosine(2251)-2'-O)-methyltransferase RlmB [Rhodohalobacter sp. SW132]|uniref:23S rRNA (guanosine(2251)-2'-O)-methyltransferase RlmB n=1 Tax=Rhodohalobacter sp. SW132 TaxID=2293433 RepID=UPI000E2769BF|nr:23S rRNA (guanosine(2251)-2'-O)-methyltransferase RlmB [Rhodohalobacter sp. SW132]REL33375.1 23S rRNA (guanosine(2251)-2'-O)-methyltransferase RlmB [Rhodohalobacter sp. SW132]